jgi:hypothetical protein
MASRVVFPAACSVAIVGPMSSVISVAVIVVHGLSEIIGGGNDFYVVDVIWPFIVDPAHDKSVATGLYHLRGRGPSRPRAPRVGSLFPPWRLGGEVTAASKARGRP